MPCSYGQIWTRSIWPSQRETYNFYTEVFWNASKKIRVICNGKKCYLFFLHDIPSLKHRFLPRCIFPALRVFFLISPDLIFFRWYVKNIQIFQIDFIFFIVQLWRQDKIEKNQYIRFFHQISYFFLHLGKKLLSIHVCRNIQRIKCYTFVTG